MRWVGESEHTYSEYELSSGRRFYANGGILGLGPGDDETVSEGYDGDVEDPDGGVRFGNGLEGRFTPDEKREIAEEMMRRWAKWGGMQDAH